MLHIVSYTLMKIYGINKKGTLGTIVIACRYSNAWGNCCSCKVSLPGAAEVMLFLLPHYLQPLARAVISLANFLLSHLSSY